ncbi:MAG: ATP-binding cassette domain-containing protein, partial [Desulfobulbia bacterium]
MFHLENENLGYKGDVVLHNISLSIAAGERVALVGRSGAGKSTLISALQSRFKSETAIIPQDMGLVRNLTVFHNVYMGRLNRNPTWYNILNLFAPQGTEVRPIRELTSSFNLGGKIFERVGELSGGQKQRTAVCRALFQGGKAILGDEPVSAVDSLQARSILEALCQNFDTIILAM